MRIFTAIGFLILLVASGAMALGFAYEVGLTHGKAWAFTFAAAAGGLLMLECSAAARRVPGGEPLRFAMLILAGLAVFSLDVGFTSQTFSDAKAVRAETARTAELKQRNTLPLSVLWTKLKRHEAQNRRMSERWCSARNTTRRALCKTWFDLREKVALAEHLEGAGVAVAGDADARAALLVRMIGGTKSGWADALVLLFAAAATIARMAGAAMLFGVSAPQAVASEAHPKPLRAAAVPPAKLVRSGPVERVAAKIYRHVVASAQPDPAQKFMGFVPPGALSQRKLATDAGLSVRKTREALDRLEADGFVKKEAGPGGTGFVILK